MVKCSQCQKSNPGEANYCNFCGSPLLDENPLDTNQSFINCTECFAAIPADSLHCPVCGIKMGQQNVKSYHHCKKCGNKFSSDKSFCPKCGTRNSTSQRDKKTKNVREKNKGFKTSNSKIKCPSCNSLNPFSKKFCSQCGKALHAYDKIIPSKSKKKIVWVVSSLAVITIGFFIAPYFKSLLTDKGIPVELTSVNPYTSEKAPKATTIANPARYGKQDAGRVLSCVDFEPSGLVIPEGIEVRWPLKSPMEPNTRLEVEVFNPSANRWEGTSEVAIVNPSGNTASGLVYHFSQRQLVVQGSPFKGKEGFATEWGWLLYHYDDLILEISTFISGKYLPTLGVKLEKDEWILPKSWQYEEMVDNRSNGEWLGVTNNDINTSAEYADPNSSIIYAAKITQIPRGYLGVHLDESQSVRSINVNDKNCLNEARKEFMNYKKLLDEIIENAYRSWEKMHVTSQGSLNAPLYAAGYDFGRLGELKFTEEEIMADYLLSLGWKIADFEGGLVKKTEKAFEGIADKVTSESASFVSKRIKDKAKTYFNDKVVKALISSAKERLSSKFKMGPSEYKKLGKDLVQLADIGSIYVFKNYKPGEVAFVAPGENSVYNESYKSLSGSFARKQGYHTSAVISWIYPAFLEKEIAMNSSLYSVHVEHRKREIANVPYTLNFAQLISDANGSSFAVGRMNQIELDRARSNFNKMRSALDTEISNGLKSYYNITTLSQDATQQQKEEALMAQRLVFMDLQKFISGSEETKAKKAVIQALQGEFSDAINFVTSNDDPETQNHFVKDYITPQINSGLGNIPIVKAYKSIISRIKPAVNDFLEWAWKNLSPNQLELLQEEIDKQSVINIAAYFSDKANYQFGDDIHEVIDLLGFQRSISAPCKSEMTQVMEIDYEKVLDNFCEKVGWDPVNHIPSETESHWGENHIVPYRTYKLKNGKEVVKVYDHERVDLAEKDFQNMIDYHNSLERRNFQVGDRSKVVDYGLFNCYPAIWLSDIGYLRMLTPEAIVEIQSDALMAQYLANNMAASIDEVLDIQRENDLKSIYNCNRKKFNECQDLAIAYLKQRAPTIEETQQPVEKRKEFVHTFLNEANYKEVLDVNPNIENFEIALLSYIWKEGDIILLNQDTPINPLNAEHYVVFTEGKFHQILNCKDEIYDTQNSISSFYKNRTILCPGINYNTTGKPYRFIKVWSKS